MGPTLTCVFGDPQYEIVCYQGLQRLSPSTRSSKQDFAQAEYLFDPSNVISCCAHAPEHPVVSEDCTDFTRYPTTGQPTTPEDADDRDPGFIGFVSYLLIATVLFLPLALLYHFRVYMRRPTKYDKRGHFTPL